MTDTSLPSQPSSVPVTPAASVDPSSYVDSYAPPAMSVAPASPVPPTQFSQPTTDASDPLAELEKALEEYEARQKQLAAQDQDDSLPAQPAQPAPSVQAAPQVLASTAPTPSLSTPDPLEELEKALNEYESRQTALADQKQEVVQEAQQVAQQAGEEDPLAELERVLDEYESKYKQEEVASEPASVASEPTSTPAPSTPATPASGEAIEEQNIFELLGVTNAQAAEKEAFLDELQEALWDDFLDKDLALLVTPEQLKEVKDLRAQAQLPENERQEKLIAKVESLVPDIEEIMLEKALELKEDMVRERISGLKEYYAQKPDELAKVHEAEQLATAGRWKSVATLLNSLTA